MKYLVFGLGNIGPEYANTRHNIGFMIADHLAQDAEAAFTAERYGDVARFRKKGRSYILIKPSTYMNLSGKAVRYWMDKEKVPVERILVVSDDIALPLGSLRMKAKGGAGGHNGLTSIIEHLGTENFARLRFGIGSEFSRGGQVDYVLGPWDDDDIKTISPRISLAGEMILSFGAIGVNRTMSAYNNK